MIEICGITKKFLRQDKAAVDNVSFEVKAGEVTALLGENGAGKTTTLRILSALLAPDRGSCIVAGIDVHSSPAAAKSRMGILLGGETGLYDRLTARENIAYFASLHSIPRKVQQERIEQISETLGLDSYLDKRCGEFSRGMKQKTSFARALIHDPEVIILDEPTTGLDLYSSLTVREFIIRCREQGRTILFSSHNTDEVRRIADRIVIIHGGKIVGDMPLGRELASDSSALESLYFSLTGEDRQERKENIN